MENDIINPAAAPKVGAQGFSPLGCALASIGAGLLTLSLLGAAAAAAAWATSRLFTLDDRLFYVLLALLMVPVVISSLWIGGRAWAVEQMLARGKGVAPPVFKLSYYFKSS